MEVLQQRKYTKNHTCAMINAACKNPRTYSFSGERWSNGWTPTCRQAAVFAVRAYVSLVHAVQIVYDLHCCELALTWNVQQITTNCAHGSSWLPRVRAQLSMSAQSTEAAAGVTGRALTALHKQATCTRSRGSTRLDNWVDHRWHTTAIASTSCCCKDLRNADCSNMTSCSSQAHQLHVVQQVTAGICQHLTLCNTTNCKSRGETCAQLCTLL